MEADCRYMDELSALLFDVDGTLADTEEIHRQAFNQSFAEAGLDWDWSRELYGRLLRVTGGRERIRHYLDAYRPEFERPGDLDGFIAHLHRAKTGIYTRILAGGKVPLRTGVRRLLAEARQAGLRLAIATTTSEENVAALLRYASASAEDISRWFDLIAAGEVVRNKKPAPDIYAYALKHLGLAAGNCLAFEDSDNGLQAARAAGIPTVVTVNRYTRHQRFEDALLVLDHLGEPGRPFTVISGDAGDATWVSIAFLRGLRARAGGAAAGGPA
jgi:HAD superfamily hydrolase (TIGR01509 family)